MQKQIKKTFLNKVLDKEVEPEADKNEDFLYVNFMEMTNRATFKWPTQLDMLNVHVTDILFRCTPPLLSPCSSSSRSSSFELTKEDLAKAKRLFTKSKENYPINFF